MTDDTSSSPMSSLSTHVRYDEALEVAQRVAARTYNGWSPERRDDLVSEVMIKYWRTWEEGPGPDSVRGWLTQVIRTTAINMHAAEQRRLADQPGGEDATETLDRMFDAVRVRLSHNIVSDQVIESTLELVGPRERQLIELKYLDNLRTAAIAEQLEMTVAATSQAIHRAKIALATALTGNPALLEELRAAMPRLY